MKKFIITLLILANIISCSKESSESIESRDLCMTCSDIMFNCSLSGSGEEIKTCEQIVSNRSRDWCDGSVHVYYFLIKNTCFQNTECLDKCSSTLCDNKGMDDECKNCIMNFSTNQTFQSYLACQEDNHEH